MVKNNIAGRGRPRGFDEQEALERATLVFRARGYDGVTIDDLVAGMRVARPSLYAVFGDKRTLFLRVLRAYVEANDALAAQALFSHGTVDVSIAAFLRNVVENATREASPPGCLIVCVAPLVDDAEVRQIVRDATAAAIAQLECRFRKGISTGELPPGFPVTARATQTLDLGRGLMLRAQVGAARKILLEDAAAAAGLLLPPQPLQVRAC